MISFINIINNLKCLFLDILSFYLSFHNYQQFIIVKDVYLDVTYKNEEHINLSFFSFI